MMLMEQVLEAPGPVDIVVEALELKLQESFIIIRMRSYLLKENR